MPVDLLRSILAITLANAALRATLPAMNKPLIAILAGLGFLVISWLFPPWEEQYGSRGFSYNGFRFIFMPAGDYDSWRVCVVRLALIDLCIIAITAGVVLALKQWKNAKP